MQLLDDRIGHRLDLLAHHGTDGIGASKDRVDQFNTEASKYGHRTQVTLHLVFIFIESQSF